MRLTSTRGESAAVTAKQAFIKGIAPDGGLFVPYEMPHVDDAWIKSLIPMDYAQRANAVLGLFLEDEYEKEELIRLMRAAYGKNFCPSAAPLVSVANAHVLELFRGPTCAFKDMALQLFPRLLPPALAGEGVREKVLILVATSGDTGKAALEGFRDVPGTEVLVFYPEGGVSQAQRLQMVTQRGGNVRAIAVRGNFDDAQTGVKQLFANADFVEKCRREGRVLSSANSINFGRLLPQVVYYFSAYADLLSRRIISPGKPINFAVPTGNFGNILAGWYSKRMGLPINRLICASNRNNVLSDFISSGEYNANRAFYKTSSPSMDILISSNLERLLYDICGHDPAAVKTLMQGLSHDKSYRVDSSSMQAMRGTFSGGWADDIAAANAIGKVFADTGYLMDPHTAVAWEVYSRYFKESGDNTPTVVIATASPYKFPRDVLTAVGEHPPEDDFECAALLEKVSKTDIPRQIKELPSLPELHTLSCEITEMEQAALQGFK